MNWDFIGVETLSVVKTTVRKTAKALLRLNLPQLDCVTVTEVLAIFDGMGDVCSLCQPYRKSLMFYVRNLTDVMSIYLRADKENTGGSVHSIRV